MSHRPRNRQPPRSDRAPRQQQQRHPPAARTTAAAAGPVPRWSQIRPGTPVSVVLKADQPTGRQVQGIVSELLTRGDHPRGVKVRLGDGRVGRVQRLATAEEAAAAGVSAEGARDPRGAGAAVGWGAAEAGAAAGRVRYSDVREDGYDYDGTGDGGGGAAPSLGDYLVVKAPRRRKGKASATPAGEGAGGPSVLAEQQQQRAGDGDGSQREDLTSARSTCPVCHSFEGDEAAVAHHVGTHFE